MAEAAVEERPPTRFYCHICNVQFQNASANFTCPHCSDGFIEELRDTEVASGEQNGDEAMEDWPDDDDMMNDFMNRTFMDGEPSRSDGRRGSRRYANSRARNLRPRTLTRIASSNLRHQNVPLERMIYDLVFNFQGGSVNLGTEGNMQLFLGNPGDYAWGREGLDAIVTQLLNQMDSTGPPPVSKAVIDSIAVVEVSGEQVKAKLQCSVCWEDFILSEAVRQLPCLHIYHEMCIRPWLELHGTCPICRQNLGGDSGENNQAPGTPPNTSNSSAAAANVQSVLRSLFGPGTSTNSTPSSSHNVDNESSGPSR